VVALVVVVWRFGSLALWLSKKYVFLKIFIQIFLFYPMRQRQSAKNIFSKF
jgi:hypothetical protein